MKNLLDRGVVTLVFDDGYQKVYDTVLPILKKHNMPGVFAIPLDGTKLEQSKHRFVKRQQVVRPWKDWIHITSDGHEVAAHSVTHTNLTKIEGGQLEQELAIPKESLEATTFVYPGGGHNDKVVEVTSKHYKAARTVIRGFETVPPKEPYRLRTFNYSRNNFSVWKANLFALWAWITNKWLIETYHMIDEDDSQMVHTVKPSEFKKHLSFLSWLPIKVKTIKQVTK